MVRAKLSPRVNSMEKSRLRYLAFFINSVLLILLFVLRYSGLATLAIGQAVPITLIPFVAAIALFYGEWYGAAAGFVAGALMDSVMTGSSCFNTLTVMLLGLICGILSTYYLNKNIQAAACVSLGASFLYLFTRLIFFYSFKGISPGAEYYGSYFIPTIFYTALFIIPFYFLEKKLKSL